MVDDKMSIPNSVAMVGGEGLGDCLYILRLRPL